MKIIVALVLTLTLSTISISSASAKPKKNQTSCQKAKNKKKCKKTVKKAKPAPKPNVNKPWFEIGLMFPEGECTEYAYNKRPDVINRFTLLEEARRLIGPTSELTFDGGGWDEVARAAGYKVDGIPQDGDLAVWESYQEALTIEGYGVSAGKPGHVAYVESVNTDGTFNLTDNNTAKGDNQPLLNVRPDGLDFIHR